MSDDIAPASLAFWAKCANCSHCWPAAYYPLSAAQFAKIAGRAICPKCGGDAMVAKQPGGKLLEESSS